MFPPHASVHPLLVAVGCLNVDIIAPVPRLPERDDRIMTTGFSKTLGGMAVNVACAAAALGPPWALRAELIAPLGEDADSVWAEAEIQRHGVVTAWLDRTSRPRVTLCLILVEASGERAILSEPSRLDYGRIGERVEAARAEPGRRHIHADGFHAPGAILMLKRARQAGWTVSLDVDELPAAYLQATRFAALAAGFDVVFINRGCAATVFGGDRAAWQTQLSALAARTGTLFLLTLGSQGCIVITPQQAPIAIAATPVATVDSTGAGDCFAGLPRLLAEWPGYHGSRPQSLDCGGALDHCARRAGLSAECSGDPGEAENTSLMRIRAKRIANGETLNLTTRLHVFAKQRFTSSAEHCLDDQSIPERQLIHFGTPDRTQYHGFI
ncbi:MAG: carbohydrate kinase family protein [Gammaproteobacteria bacterium]